MQKTALVFIFITSVLFVHAQNNFFVFRKGEKILSSFYKESYIAFQTGNKEWQSGYITKIQNDSFWMKPALIYYGLFKNDTVRFSELAFSFADVYAMPKKGVQVHYQDGSFQIARSAGHIHWYWIKSGWVFRVGAAGYAGLHILNGLIKNDFSFSKSKTELGIAASVFLFGSFLHMIYTPVWKLNRRYILRTVELPHKYS